MLAGLERPMVSATKDRDLHVVVAFAVENEPASKISGYCNSIFLLLTPSSEPARSLRANGACAAGAVPETAVAVAGAICWGGMGAGFVSVSELREPFAPALGGGDCAFLASGCAVDGGLTALEAPSEVCILRFAEGRPCGGGWAGAFLDDLLLKRNDMV